MFKWKNKIWIFRINSSTVSCYFKKNSKTWASKLTNNFEIIISFRIKLSHRLCKQLALSTKCRCVATARFKPFCLDVDLAEVRAVGDQTAAMEAGFQSIIAESTDSLGLGLMVNSGESVLSRFSSFTMRFSWSKEWPAATDLPPWLLSLSAQEWCLVVNFLSCILQHIYITITITIMTPVYKYTPPTSFDIQYFELPSQFAQPTLTDSRVLHWNGSCHSQLQKLIHYKLPLAFDR